MPPPADGISTPYRIVAAGGRSRLVWSVCQRSAGRWPLRCQISPISGSPACCAASSAAASAARTRRGREILLRRQRLVAEHQRQWSASARDSASRVGASIGRPRSTPGDLGAERGMERGYRDVGHIVPRGRFRRSLAAEELGSNGDARRPAMRPLPQAGKRGSQAPNLSGRVLPVSCRPARRPEAEQGQLRKPFQQKYSTSALIILTPFCGSVLPCSAVRSRAGARGCRPLTRAVPRHADHHRDAEPEQRWHHQCLENSCDYWVTSWDRTGLAMGAVPIWRRPHLCS